MSYKSTAIYNRRYLGNKYKLLPFIQEVIQKNCSTIHVFADLFAGTGVVSSAFTDKVIITNDILYSNYICNLAWFGPQKFDSNKIKDIIIKYNSIQTSEENYMSLNFANTFFSQKDCSKIGYIREDIEQKFNHQLINERERALLITSLLYGMDKIAKTCGHYDAYRRGVVFDKSIELFYPTASNENNVHNQCYNLNINNIAKYIQADLIYLDPPYNSRQYCDAYHLLENVAKWEKPIVKGIAKKMNRENIKSDYCTKAATQAFEDLIQSIHTKYILLSYNNMEQKGNARSNAKISDEDIFRILNQKGTVKVFSENYKPFTTGKSNIIGNKERLFLCKCNEE